MKGSKTDTSKGSWTRVVRGKQRVIDVEADFFSGALEKIDTCMDYTRPHLAISLPPITDAFMAAKNRGVKLRYITEITEENLPYCKKLMTIVDELRHLHGVKNNFMVSEKAYLSPVILWQEAETASELICSELKQIVDQQQYIFDTFWSKSIPAERRIRDIEGGIDAAEIEIIQDPAQAINRAWDISRSAETEICIMFSSSKALERQIEMGGLETLKQASELHQVKIRILVPRANEVDQLIFRIKSVIPEIDIRTIDASLETRISILVADNKECLVLELKNDTETSTYRSVGLSWYSNSRSIVSSYSSIFESFWTQTELYEKLREIETLEKDFINIAAHELRNPIQPIVGLSELLYSRLEDKGQRELLAAVITNAKRLERLAEIMLDVTRIESHSLKLTKELFDIGEVLNDLIIHYNKRIGKIAKNGHQILFNLTANMKIYVDKTRIMQVISNLLDNAIKFAEGEHVYVNLKREETKNDKAYVIVSVMDEGQGIDAGLLPKLFTKFISKSEIGTGLGLFISKGIIEAHGGRIWAQNNPTGKGATFSFSLPLAI